MTIYELLEKKKKRRKPFENSEEYDFYIRNKELLLKIPRYSFLYNMENNEFDIMRSNIVIYSILSKQAIEKEIFFLSKKHDINSKTGLASFLNSLKEKIIDLPYLQHDKTRVYIPIFSLPLNIIYAKEPQKLLYYPYNLLTEEYKETTIDCFDTYRADLYDSLFTKLIKISTNGQEIAYFHYDTNTVYVVNNQGRLDNKIVLFDRFIKKVYDNHMVERLKVVMDAYFQNSRSNFVESLFEQQFISEKIYLILKKGNYRNEK